MSKFSHDSGRHRQGYDSTSTFSLKTAEPVPLLIVNNYSELQANIFSNNRDITKCPSCRMMADDNDPKAMTIPRRFLRKQMMADDDARAMIIPQRFPRKQLS